MHFTLEVVFSLDIVSHHWLLEAWPFIIAQEIRYTLEYIIYHLIIESNYVFYLPYMCRCLKTALSLMYVIVEASVLLRSVVNLWSCI